MSLFINNQQSPGKDRPFNIFPPEPIVLNRAPTVNDRGSDFGQLWIQNKDSNGNLLNLIWIFTNPGVWTSLEAGGGAGIFTSLTVTGPTTLTGTTNINTAGAAVTNIGTGGTGAVNIGNTTGDTSVTGALTTSQGITASTGNIIASTGNLVSTAGSVIANQSVAGATLYAGGDLGGVATTTGISNVTATATGTGTTTFKPNAATANITQAGWAKIYIGTTAAYIPYFTAI